MELHHQLQALVQQRGQAVLTDPDALRAALEDYLDEQTASTGDLNLLVDAVRLGGLSRLRSASQGGALPGAAVETAGDFLARQRGSSDVTSAQWACAALGYAVGLVPDQVPTSLRRNLTSGGSAGFPPSGPPVASPPPMMSPHPQMSPTQQPWQSGPSGPQSGPGYGPPQGQPGPPTGWSGAQGAPYAQPPKKSKAPLIAVGAVVALLAVGGGIAWAVASGDDDDKKAGGGETTSQGTDITEPPNGGPKLEDLSPEEIKNAVVDDMSAVESLNMAGTVEADQVRLDLSIDVDGKCAGSMEVEGGSASLISDGEDEYLKGDQRFWEFSSGGSAPSEVLDMLVGKWIRSPGTENFADFCDLNNLLDEFNNDGAVDFEVAGTSVVNGREALELRANDGSKIFVANQGPHHILRLVNEGSDAGEFTLSQFDKPLDIEAPADYIDQPGS
ncbi:hypothetical protein [Nocardioides alcanivorans]|uniref:hypothetical protein n=1 Tax=Nocardioides alcanivorans TaxID=2897352 RepID=UPI001F35C0F3|nr:hypothetical protein [Nocardioides alcanivorans]